MEEYKYGVLESSCSKDGINPTFVNCAKIESNKSLDIDIRGNGKIIQISYLTNKLSVLLVVNDNKINNGYCLKNLCDTRGIGYIQYQQAHDNFYRVTCLIPFGFWEEITIRLLNGASDEFIVQDFHVYYMVRK